MRETGVAVDHEKIRKIQEIPRPESVVNVRSFLGLAGYYRRFIGGFAEIAAPLHSATSAKRQIEWNEEREQAFNTL